MLGDWVNLMGHQKAAKEMLTQLYTTETITQSDSLLKIILWYIRFDLFLGLQSGMEASLGREWYQAVHTHLQQKVLENPDNLSLKYDERFAHSRLIAKDSSDLFAQIGKGTISTAEFMERLPRLGERVHALEHDVDAMLLDPKYKIQSLPGSPDPGSIVNAYEPGVLWGGDHWVTNYLYLEMWGIICMYNVSSSMALRRPFEPKMAQIALRTAQMFEAIRKCPEAPPGAIIEAQASLAIAILFLPKDPKTVQWCRQTLAQVESLG